MSVTERLFALRDEGFAEFQAKLMPTVDPGTVIGVRTPLLRKLASELSGSEEAEGFLKSLPHRFYEENNLHAFLIEKIRDFDTCLGALDAFLPFVDNWATCDCMRPKCLKKQPDRLYEKILEWLGSGKTYTVRYGIGLLLSFYLDGEFKIEHLDLVAGLRSGEYYINMMRAWYFATALAKQYDAAVPYIEGKKLDARTHNKAIQKSVESYRITDEKKNYLKTLKINQRL